MALLPTKKGCVLFSIVLLTLTYPSSTLGAGMCKILLVLAAGGQSQTVVPVQQLLPGLQKAALASHGERTGRQKGLWSGRRPKQAIPGLSSVPCHNQWALRLQPIGGIVIMSLTRAELFSIKKHCSVLGPSSQGGADTAYG